MLRPRKIPRQRIAAVGRALCERWRRMDGLAVDRVLGLTMMFIGLNGLRGIYVALFVLGAVNFSVATLALWFRPRR
jgi:hypothetical protein